MIHFWHANRVSAETRKNWPKLKEPCRQEKRSEVRQRATVIRLLHLGHKPEAVAEQQMVSVPTIYNWHKLWREQGIEGLANKPRKRTPAQGHGGLLPETGRSAGEGTLRIRVSVCHLDCGSVAGTPELRNRYLAE